MNPNLQLPSDPFSSLFPTTIASAATIAPVTAVSFISGTISLVNITPPVNATHQLILIFTHATPGVLSTAGNIQLAVTPITNGSVILTYDPRTKKYYPIVVGGSGAAPGGANTQIQFNNAGALDGDAGLTWDGFNLSIVNNEVTSQGSTSIDSTVTPVAPGEVNIALTVIARTAGAQQVNYIAAQINELHHAATGGGDFVVVVSESDMYLEAAAGLMNAATVSYNTVTTSSAVQVGALTVNYNVAIHNSTGAIATLYGVYSEIFIGGGSGAITNLYGFYSKDLAATATNAYYFWADSQGVYRIREDNVADSASFPQAITALYNPRFTKYTAGAANYERIVQQWVNNVAQIGTEKGGTGTLRQLSLIGLGVTLPGGTLLTTATALTNGAAAAAGTLLNAPAAGNPTKWIPINDNGTTRYIPAW